MRHWDHRLLFVSSSPASVDGAPVDSESERVRIREVVKAAGEGMRIRFIEDLAKATRPRLMEALRREEPEILHVSCHGAPVHGLILEDEYRNADRVPSEWIVKRLQGARRPPRLVVFSACFSEEHVRAIAEACPEVESVGFVGEIYEKHACNYLVQLYRELAAGREVAEAVAEARGALPEVVQGQVVAGGPGTYRLPRRRPGSWAVGAGFALALGSASWFFFQGEAASDPTGAEVASGETTRDESTSAATGMATTTGDEPTSAATGTTTPGTATMTTGPTTTSPTTTTSAATGTTTGPPRAREATLKELRRVLDACRPAFPRDRAQVVLTWRDDGGGYEVAGYADQPCGAGTLCGCMRGKIQAVQWRAPRSTGRRVLDYNAADVSSERLREE